ncbi:MAG: 4-hydroxythreonine-4-phosphate dehydrogenase PdxA [Rheinheimera sp.]|nr:4-hydroxythreonine-4-phosphate dehydrogenase PdxA [Rheinheimera sp.]
MLGLNPHSGDNGVIGKENDLILKPVINDLFEKGLFVFEPYASDGFFGNQMHLVQMLF